MVAGRSKSIKCPICGTEINYSDLPVPKDDIALVAVDHGDHIVVVKYDQNGFIRDFSVYPVGVDNAGKTVEKCPICGKDILIPLANEYPSEFLYNHGDHVVVLYMFDTDLYTINTIPLVKARESPGKIFVNKLINIIGIESLSSILAHVALGDLEVIHAPKEAIPLLGTLFEKIDISHVHIEPGEIDFLPPDFYRFFQKIIENHIGNPEALIDKLRSGILLIEKVADLINSVMQKAYYIDPVKDLLGTLKRKGLDLLVIRKLQISGNNKIEKILNY